MTDIEELVGRIEALREKATPGPWHLRTNRHRATNGREWGWLDASPSGGPQNAIPGVSVTWEEGQTSAANARLIAALVRAWPQIATALTSQSKEIERLTRERDEAVDSACALSSNLANEFNKRLSAERALTAAETRATQAEKDAERWRRLRDTPCTVTFDVPVTFTTPNEGRVIHVRMIGNTELDAAISARQPKD